MKVKVNIRSRQMLPKFTDEQLTAIAGRVGLSLEQLNVLHCMANATYQAIGADLAQVNNGKCIKRRDLIEIVMDASHIESFGISKYIKGSEDPAIKDWLRNRSMEFKLDDVYAAIGVGFPYPEYE